MTTRPAARTARHVDAVYGVSRWTDYLYTRRHEIDPLRAKIAATTRAMTGANTNAAELRRQRRLAQSLGRELFARLLDGDAVQQLESPAAGTDTLQQLHGALAELPEFDTLRQQTAGDADMAALAAAELLSTVPSALAAIEREQQREQQQQQRRDRGLRVRGAAADPAGAVRRAMRAATGSAAKRAAAAAADLNGLQPGLGDCPPANEQEDPSRLQLAQRLQRDERLRRIMRLAGRLQRIAADTRPMRDDRGRDELVGVTLGGDLPIALPPERALMRHPRMRRVQLAKLADRRIAQYRLVGKSPQGRGPIVVMLDESGSMRRRERFSWAAAIAIACLGIAANERRACTIIGFAASIRRVYRLEANGTARDLATGQQLDGVAEIALRIAGVSPRGGTTFDAPLRRALQLGAAGARADLVLVTDGHADASESTLQQLADARAEHGLRCFGLTVGGGSLGAAVAQICDRIVDLDAAIGDSDAKGVAGALP